jgi:hypothetical protein
MPKGQDCLLQVVLPLLVSMPPVYALKTHKIREAIATSSIQFEKVEPIQFNVEIVFQVMRKSTLVIHKPKVKLFQFARRQNGEAPPTICL